MVVAQYHYESKRKKKNRGRKTYFDEVKKGRNYLICWLREWKGVSLWSIKLIMLEIPQRRQNYSMIEVIPSQIRFFFCVSSHFCKKQKMFIYLFIYFGWLFNLAYFKLTKLNFDGIGVFVNFRSVFYMFFSSLKLDYIWPMI